MSKFVVKCFLVLGILVTVVSCGTKEREAQITRQNRVAIAENIPVPTMDFSSRRYNLAQFYKQFLNNKYLRTCTAIVGRGEEGGFAYISSLGPAVNLSNQMTDPEIEEPDSVFTSPNDQTLVVYRNGRNAIVTEMDTTTVIGDCPPPGKAKRLQDILDYNEGKEPQVNLRPTGQ